MDYYREKLYKSLILYGSKEEKANFFTILEFEKTSRCWITFESIWIEIYTIESFCQKLGVKNEKKATIPYHPNTA